MVGGRVWQRSFNDACLEGPIPGSRSSSDAPSNSSCSSRAAAAVACFAGGCEAGTKLTSAVHSTLFIICAGCTALDGLCVCNREQSWVCPTWQPLYSTIQQHTLLQQASSPCRCVCQHGLCVVDVSAPSYAAWALLAVAAGSCSSCSGCKLGWPAQALCWSVVWVRLCLLRV